MRVRVRVREIACFIFLFLLGSLAWGQNSMSSTSSGSWSVAQVSNFNNCVTTGYNCWHASSVELGSVSSNYGMTVGLNSTGQFVKYTNYTSHTNPNTWAVQTSWGSGFTSVAVGGPKNIWAVGPSEVCGHGTTNIHIYNGTSWGENLGCKHVVHVAADQAGDGGGVESGVAWLYTVSNNTWQEADTTKNWIWMFIQSSDTVYLVRNDHTVWVWSVGTGYTQLSNMTIADQVVGSKSGHIYVLGTDTYVYHYNPMTGIWDKLFGSGYTSITAGGAQDVWATGPTNAGYNTYRFSETGMGWSRTFSGTVTCGSNVPPSLCSTFHHTSTGQLSSQGHNGAVVNGTPFYGSGNFGWTAYVETNDVFLCIEDPQGCVVVEDIGNMECSGGGSAVDNPVYTGPNLSQDFAEWDKTASVSNPVETIDRLWVATATCNATHTDPLVGPTCIGGGEGICYIPDAISEGPGEPTGKRAQLAALAYCGASSPWSAEAFWFQNVPGCFEFDWNDNAEIPGFCY